MKEKIKGFLPCFDGFYNSMLEFDYDMCIYNIEEDRQEKGIIQKFDSDKIEIDYKSYCNDMSINAVQTIGEPLLDMNLIVSVEFENLYSPREYNFETDSINCIYSITEENKKNILEYIKNNIDEFETYIKDRYTSRSGFMSFYSNDFRQWIKEFESWNMEKIDHKFSSVLEFILLNEEEQYYYSMEISENFTISNSCDQYITNYDELLK
jgi:hypothetical protein